MKHGGLVQQSKSGTMNLDTVQVGCRKKNKGQISEGTAGPKLAI
jgi:hypothetical protein